MQDNLEGGELDLAVAVRRRCKNSSSLSCIGKRTKEGYDRGRKVRIVLFIAGEAGKDQFPEN